MFEKPDIMEDTEYLSLIIERMPTGCVMWGPDFRVTLWNPGAEAIFGYSADEAFGKHAYDLIVDEKVVPDIDRIWERLVTGDKTAHSVNENITKNGDTIICDWHNTPVIKDGELIGVLSMVQDITEHKLADRELLESRDRLDTIGKAAFEGIVISENGIVIDTNEQMCEMLGCRPDELKGMEVMNFVAPEHRSLVAGYIKEDSERAYEHLALKKNGSRIVVEARGKKSTYQGKPVRITAIRDITERKRNEERLTELAEEMRLYLFALESVEDEVYLIAPDGRFQYVNNAACAKLGYGKDELLSLTTPDLDPLYQQEVWDRHFSELREKGSLKFESLHRRKDGSTFPVEILANYFEYEGKGYNLAFARDITERKESEERFRKTIESSPIGIFISKGGRFIDVNDAGLRLVGAETKDDVLGKLLTEFIAPEYREEVTQRNVAREGGHEQLRRYEITGLKLDGSRHPIEVSVSSITLQNDIATIAFIQDITERKKHEERILSALREKEVLLREVHHRVKNNMAIISSLLSLQAGYINESNYLEKFMETRGRIRSMAMVHEKIYRKQELSSIDVKDYIESLIEGIELTFAKRISINNMFDIEDVALDIDTLIPCGLIINEIITNASKYAFDEQESPQIIIRLRKHDAENIQLTIEDNGKGFPEGFDISKSDGLGLKLVEMLTGQLNAKLDIKYTQGPRFTFTFPKHIKLARP